MLLDVIMGVSIEMQLGNSQTPIKVYTNRKQCNQQAHGSYLPIQNWLKTLSNTSSVTPSPLTSLKAETANLRSIVQKSMGRSSLMLVATVSKASWARMSASACLALTAHPTPPAMRQLSISYQACYSGSEGPARYVQRQSTAPS